MNSKNKNFLKIIILLHIILLVYSFTGVLSKIASFSEFLSFKFIICYGSMIGILGLYAILWQQIIKVMPLTMAFANKAITVVWGIVWGFFIFGEVISIGKIIGASLIIFGIVLYSISDSEESEERIEHE